LKHKVGVADDTNNPVFYIHHCDCQFLNFYFDSQFDTFENSQTDQIKSIKIT